MMNRIDRVRSTDWLLLPAAVERDSERVAEFRGGQSNGLISTTSHEDAETAVHAPRPNYRDPPSTVFPIDIPEMSVVASASIWQNLSETEMQLCDQLGCSTLVQDYNSIIWYWHGAWYC